MNSSRQAVFVCLAIAFQMLCFEKLYADPCGMVPPVYIGNAAPLARQGLQRTYVFYKDGVESIVIRPGFTGSVDQFGMLIPFPSPPELRKVPDLIFEQLDAAIDPPEVVVQLWKQQGQGGFGGGVGGGGVGGGGPLALRTQTVEVLKEEAVGMYEVAVLEAGSAAALKKWLKENDFQYPEGMDDVANEYIEARWCFVAVKTKVGKNEAVQPAPGQRDVDTNLPNGSAFDGHVQAMAFRFAADELVVPMRLSAFNDGDLRNIVYLLTDGPRRIRNIPEEYVVRQVKGTKLFKNLTRPLPLRIIGGTSAEIPATRRESLKEERDPTPHNGLAKTLFASDLHAVASGNLSLELEEEGKDLFAVNEQFGLRGPEIDLLITEVQQDSADKLAKAVLDDLKEMTLTMVDGHFPRSVIATQNLKFAQFAMSRRRNSARRYDAKLKGPAQQKPGKLIGQVDLEVWEAEQQHASTQQRWFIMYACVSVGVVLSVRRKRRA